MAPSYTRVEFDDDEDGVGGRTVSPSQVASCWSKLVFAWQTPLFKQGADAKIMPADMENWPLRSNDNCDAAAELLESCWQSELVGAKTRGRTPHLLRALFAAFGTRVVTGGLWKFGYQAAVFVNVFCIRELLNGLAAEPVDGEGFWWAGLLLAPTMGLCQFGQSVCQHHLWNTSQVTGMCARSGITTLIFSKCLRLRDDDIKGSSKDVVTLMTSDTERMVMSCAFVHWFWASIVEILVCLLLSAREIGWSALAGLFVMCLATPVQGALAKRIASTRRMVVKATDQRVRMMNEVLTGIKIIKLFGWETAFVNRVSALRNKEIEGLLRGAAIKSANSAVAFVLPMLVCLASFTCYQALGHELTVPKVFACLALFNVMYRAINMLPMSVEKLAEAKVALDRLNQFVTILEDETEACNAPSDRLHAIAMRGASFRWGPSAEQECLKRIDVTVIKQEVTALIGRVGCGKTSFLAGVLGEAQLQSGVVEVLSARESPIAYVPQQPWIVAGTIRENILMGQSLDKHRYDKVCFVCALETDLKAMPAGDLTEIGERGLNLSGGQKLRVNLARAVYQRDAELVLLDDPLSAVDAAVGSHLLEHCIFGLLREEARTVVMATHQLHSLSRCDHVILLDNGEIVAKGTPADVSMADHEFGPLLAEVLDVSPSLKSASSGRDSSEEEQKVELEHVDEKDSPGESAKAGSKLVSTEDRASGSVGWPTYRAYIIAGGGAYFALLVCLVSAACQAARIGADIWLAVWAEGVDSNADESDNLSSLDLSPPGYVAVYALLTAIVIPLNIGRTFGFVLGTVRSSRTLHNSMFGHVAAAPMIFFEENPLGRILNRFANDMDALDTMMPWSALAAFQIAFTAFGAVFASIAALPVVIVILPPLFVVFLRIQKLYLSTSREIKRIEGVNKSPVYALFSVSLPGLACIRAGQLQDHFRALFVGSLDRFHRPHYLFLGGSRWVGIRLDALSNALVLTVACTVVWLRGSISPALAGVVLTQSMQLTGVLQYGIRQSAEVENLMTSVERIRAYATLESEEDAAMNRRGGKPALPPPAGWPSKGEIRFENVKLRYRPGLPLAADGVSIHLKGGTRCGVIGRTGAGKSTLLSALFRLVELESGSITIDGVNIVNIPVAAVREAITVIPQEPLLFSGSVRENLVDPDVTDNRPDSQLLDVLEQCSMRATIQSTTSGLDTEVGEAGSNFSVGERQLLCLARAMLRNTRVLCLDEATAAVDMETDARIQVVVRKSSDSQGITLLTIAHRLQTIIDYDSIIEMDAGKAVGAGSPRELLARPDSLLSQLVSDTDEDTQRSLREKAA